MARVRALAAGDLPEEHRDEFETFEALYQRNANLVPHYAHCPEIMRYIFGMGAEFRRLEILPPRLVEIIVVTVSKVNDCPYCTAHHSNRAIELGLAAETMENILELEPRGLNPTEILVRDYARLVTERPWGIRDAVYEALAEAFGEREIVAITMRATLAGMFNKINMALQIEMEDGVLDTMLDAGIGSAHLPSPAA